MTGHSPLLIVVAGPGRGQSIPVDRALTIGRDESSGLAIPDLALSRRHCEIDVLDGRAVLRDLGSRNGCFVNSRPVSTHTLQDGDRIRIGDSALLYLEPGKRTVSPDLANLLIRDETPVPAESTVALEPTSGRFHRGAGSSPVAQQTASSFALLLRLSDTVQRVSSIEAMRKVLLEETLNAVPADLAAVLTEDESGNSPRAVMMARRGHLTSVSSAVAQRALADRVAVFANGLPGGRRPADATSIDQAPPRSVLCAPLMSGEPGAIYLARCTDTPFTEDDLHLVAAIGSIGGLALDRVAALEALQEENARLQRASSIDHDLIGETPSMQAVYAFISRVAATEATVLIRGESGTGKELVARAIHGNGPRSHGPFVAINCAALPEGLLESELFGHERGAFTGAVAQQRGRLELAAGGTVFLDEIGELAPALQAKLLRVLQDRIVERLGGRRAIPIDLRIVAATNRDLDAAIASGDFRRDLYYRLNVVSFAMPPLRERRDDIPLLALYFVRKHAARCKRVVRGLSTSTRQLLRAYDWPGNVRELENAIERAVVLGTNQVIEPEDLPETLLERAPTDEAPEGYHAAVSAHKRLLIREALDRSNGNVAEAARALGLQPTYLHRLIRNLNLRANSVKSNQ